MHPRRRRTASRTDRFKCSRSSDYHSSTSHIYEQRKRLPIYNSKDSLIQLIGENQVVVVLGETGSGKTTQIPQYLLDSSSDSTFKVIVTQPRRVAAQSLATRVAQERGVKLGEEVGFTVRFNDMTSSRTKISFVTDGILLREMSTDPLLSCYSAIVLDEVHERSINSDLLISLLKVTLQGRPDLKLVISSATFETTLFSKFFSNAPVLKVPGKTFEITEFFTKSAVSDYVDAACRAVFDILTNPDYSEGDILVFLTGQDDIDDAINLINDRLEYLPKETPSLLLLPLFSALPLEEQAKVFNETPLGSRKVVFSTNIAETSVTIPNILFVIDSGLCKQRTFNPKMGTSSLVITPISKASAKQRKGRAGRVANGHCFRLYSKWVFDNELEDVTPSEISRSELDSMVLTLFAMGVTNLIEFPFLEKPPVRALARALDNLYALGILDSSGKISKLGKRASLLPIDPHYSVCLLNSVNYSVFGDISTIIAILSSPPIIVPKRKSQEESEVMGSSLKPYINELGDHITLINIFNSWVNSNKSKYWARQRGLHFGHLCKVFDVKSQLDKLAIDLKFINSVSSTGNSTSILRSLLTGLFQNLAYRRNFGEGFRSTRHGQAVSFHPSSFLSEHNADLNLVMFSEIFEQEDFCYLRTISKVTQEDVVTVVPHVYSDYLKSLK
ncbi:hypothetical protein P9112_004708 [Eukaryota sp. TZLM1-RC]